MFICNERFWYLVQDTLSDFLQHFHTDGTFLWSMKANDYVKVGNKYNSYEYGGKQNCYLVVISYQK